MDYLKTSQSKESSRRVRCRERVTCEKGNGTALPEDVLMTSRSVRESPGMSA